MALKVSPYYRNFPVEISTIMLENNTFVDNFYEQFKADGAAAIYFVTGTSHVSACRFVDNKAGKNPFTGVVTISKSARVTFSDTYFENKQTEFPSNQLFSLGNQKLRFAGLNTFNLIDLKEKQSVFMRVPTALSTGVIIDKNFNILCPQGFKLNPQLFCSPLKSRNMCYYINVKCEQCPMRTYTTERGELVFNKSNNIHCEHCPRGGNCDSGLVKAKPNFWGYKKRKKVSFVQCPPGYCCDSKDCVSYDSCRGKRSGTLCGQCPPGMSEGLFSTHCISNTKCSINSVFVLGMTGMLVLYLVFFLWHREIVTYLKKNLFSKRSLFSVSGRTEQRINSNTDGDVSSSSGAIKILFYYYQVCNLLRGSVGSSEGGGLIITVENTLSRIMNMVLIFLPSLNCPLENLRPVGKAVLVHSIGYCLLCLLGLLHILSKLFLVAKRTKQTTYSRQALQHISARSRQERKFSQRLNAAFTYISLLMYASSAQLCLSLLHCVPVAGNQVLFLDGNIKCYQPFQYFLIAYVIASILPFCLVPVLGSYLLKFGRIGVKQFCVACIFPLPFCCFWMYLFFQNFYRGNQTTMQQNSNVEIDEQEGIDTDNFFGEGTTFLCTASNVATSNTAESAILRVLLGPFRSHKAFMCFPSSRIPWEGFLIFRRLALIVVLNFVYNIQVKLFLALTLCVTILLFHMFVYPFERKRDNVLESFSLGSHVVLCGLTLIKALYYGEDYSFTKSLPVLNVVETVLVVAPLLVVIILVIFCLIIKFAFRLKVCATGFLRIISRIPGFIL